MVTNASPLSVDHAADPGDAGGGTREPDLRLRALADAVPGVLAYVDREERVVYVSEGSRDLHGLVPDQVVGRTVREISSPSAYSRVQPYIRRALAGETVQYDRTHPRGDGTNREVRARLVPDLGADGRVRGYFGLFTDVTDLVASQRELADSQARLLRRQEALSRLAASAADAADSPAIALARIVELAALELGIERVSVWVFDEARSAIVCEDLFERAAQRHSSGTRLLANDYPRYFAALFAREAIDAGDAHADPRTSEFSAGYLRPLGIGAMLDAPIIHRGGAAGVLCCEHVGGPRTWSAEERLFAVALANHAALMLEGMARLRAEKALRASEHSLRALLGNLPGYAYRCANDRDWTLEFASDGVEALTGYRAAEFVTQRSVSFAELIHADDRDRVWKAAQSALAGRELFDLEYRILTRTGEEKWVWDRAQGVFSLQGELLRIEGLINDISDRKRAEAALVLQTERLRIAQEAARTIVMEWQVRDDIIEFSDAEQWLRGPRPSPGGKYPRFRDQVHPEDREQFLAVLRSVQETGQSQPLEFRFVRTDGLELWILWHQVAIRGANGSVERLIQTLQDVTLRKRAEGSLRLSEARFQDFARASGDWFWETDADGRFTAFIDSAAGVKGTAASWHLGKLITELVERSQELETEPWKSHLEALGRREEFRDFRFSRKSQRGESWVSVSGIPVYAADGAFLGYRGTGTDVTRQVTLEVAARLADERLRGAIELLNEPVVLTDADERIVLANRAFRAEFPATAQASIGKRYEAFLRESVAQGYLPDAIRNEEAWIAERMARRRSGTGSHEQLRPHGAWVRVNDQRLPDGSTITFTLDVTASKRQAEDLEAQNRELERRVAERTAALAHLAAIVETASDGMVTRTPEGTILSWNRGAARMFGYSAEEAIGRDISIIAAPEDRHLALRNTELLRAEQPAPSFEAVRQRKDGEPIAVEISVAAIADADGRMSAVASVFHDITARRKAERELQETQKYLETLVEMLPTGVVVHDNGVVRYANREALRIIGATEASQFIGRDLLDHFDIATREQIAERIRAIYQQEGNPVPGEVRIRRLDGIACPIEISARLVSLKGERLVLTVANDITTRTQQKEALGESEARLRAVIDVLPTLIYCKDRDGRYLMCNRANAATFGRTPEDMLDRSVQEVNLPAHQAREIQEAERLVRETGRTQVLADFRLVDRDGRERAYHCTRIPFRYSDAHPDAVLGVITEITDLMIAQSELKQLNLGLEQRVAARTVELAAANREMEAFSYSISHDLRAPARAMSGFAGILMEDHAAAFSEDARKLVERIAAAGVRMGAMIDGLLELARLSRTAVRRQRVDLAALAREIWAEVAANEPQRMVAFEVCGDCAVDCDPVLVRNVLQNLLGNAFKYTRRTPVARVEFGAFGEGAERTFYVRDNGAGFDMAYAGKLFGTFQRLHGANEFEGTGVGLSTVRRIVERHGGRIWAEASPNEGASFQFTLAEGAT